MPTHTGRGGIVKVGGNVVAEVNDWTLNVTPTHEEDTEGSDLWQTYKRTYITWTCEINCWWDDDDTTGQAALYDAIVSGAEVAIELYPAGDTSGKWYYSGNALPGDMGITVPKGPVIERAIPCQGTGPLTRAVNP